MNFRTIILGIFYCTIWACENNENIDSNLCSDSLKFIGISYDTMIIEEFSYNAQNFMIEDKSKYLYKKYNYDNSNKLISIDNYEDPALWSSTWSVVDSARKRKEWISPLISKITFTTNYYYNQNGRLDSSVNYLGCQKYIYNNNKISKILFYHDNIQQHDIEYKYDKMGNLIKETNYSVLNSGDKILFKENRFEFDNKSNPYKLFGIDVIPGRYSNINNVIKRVYSYPDIENENKIISKTYKTHYEYDSNGYPIKKYEEDNTTNFIYE